MKVTINIDLDKFRYSLVGDGYILEEVENMPVEKLINILTRRITLHIDKEYSRSRRLGLLDNKIRDTWCTNWKQGNDIGANMRARSDFFKGE